MERIISSWAHRLEEWNGNFQAQALFRSFFANFLNLQCYLIPADNFDSWQVIHAFYEKLLAVDYEIMPSLASNRFRYNEKNFRAVIQSRKPHCSAHLGSYGLFVPVVEKGKCTAILQTGIFLRNVPSEQALSENWKILTGRFPKTQDNEFLKYVRIVLEAPILESKHVEKLQSAMEWYGALLTGQKGWREVLNYFRECNRFFAREFEQRNWIKNVLVERKFFRRPSYVRELMDWEREELGLTRFPTAVLAVKRDSTGRELSDLLAARKLQMNIFQVARQTGELLTSPLSHYGSLVLASSPEEYSSSRKKVDLKRIADHLAFQLSKKLECRIFIGVGRRSHRDVDLNAAYNEAVTALHLAESQKRQVVFFEDSQEKLPSPHSLRLLPRHLADFLREKGGKDFHLFRGKFVEGVLQASHQRPEAVRRVFLESVHRIAEMIEERRAVEPAILKMLEHEAEESLDSAPSLNEMIDRFERTIVRLAPFLDQPFTAEKQLRLQKAQETLIASLEKSWTLPAIARQFGFSTTSFSRGFSKFTGLSFSEYLLGQRIEKAKRLLLGGSLPLSHIADACGFSTTNYFLQVFKKKVGQSPGKYRYQDAHKNEYN